MEQITLNLNQKQLERLSSVRNFICSNEKIREYLENNEDALGIKQKTNQNSINFDWIIAVGVSLLTAIVIVLKVIRNKNKEQSPF